MFPKISNFLNKKKIIIEPDRENLEQNGTPIYWLDPYL